MMIVKFYTRFRSVEYLVPLFFSFLTPFKSAGWLAGPEHGSTVDDEQFISSVGMDQKTKKVLVFVVSHELRRQKRRKKNE